MRYLFTYALLGISCFIFPTYAQTLKENIDALILQTLPYATVGVFIEDAETGQPIYEHHANKLLNPASNIKMFTAAAALYHLGADDHYLTSLSQDNKNIYITFSGDPSLTTTDLKQLLDQLNLSGIKTIAGNIVLDTSQFKPPYYAAGVSYDDLGWYYAAPSTAIILNENAVTYDFISAKKLGRPIQLKPQNADKILTLINDVRTVSKEDAKNHCNLDIDIKANNTLRLYGCLAQEEHPVTMHLAIPNPTLYATQVVKNALQQQHILLKGNIIEGKTPAGAKRIASHSSKDLKTLVAHMLEESDNLYADSLTKRLAYSLTKEGTYKQGAFAIQKILADHVHIDKQQIVLADGLGTRYNVVTAKQLVMFLSDVYHDQAIKSTFMDALPRMGVSGTLKDRMKKTSLENNVFAKTGSMHDISAISGYLRTSTGKTFIFSIMSNGIDGRFIQAKELEERILRIVYEESLAR